MNSKEAFKIAFLLKCAEDGCDARATSLRILEANLMAKNAGVLSDIGSGLKNVVSTVGPAAMLAPAAVGAYGGYALSKATNPEVDTDSVLQDEEIENYRDALKQLLNTKKQMEAREQEKRRAGSMRSFN